MVDIPHFVADCERIVRGICSPYHVQSNGRLKPAAFDAPAESDEVSVIRHEYIDADTCKHHGKTLSSPKDNKFYKGLAVIRVKSVRLQDADVVDSRHVFHGHADIKHGHKKSKLDPPSPEIVKKLNERCKALAKLAVYFADPEPDSQHWTGPLLSC
jgi:hypothetical protein